MERIIKGIATTRPVVNQVYHFKIWTESPYGEWYLKPRSILVEEFHTISRTELAVLSSEGSLYVIAMQNR